MDKPQYKAKLIKASESLENCRAEIAGIASAWDGEGPDEEQRSVFNDLENGVEDLREMADIVVANVSDEEEVVEVDSEDDDDIT